VKGSDWTIERIVRKTTLAGILNDTVPSVYQTDSSGRWTLTNSQGVFTANDALIKHNATHAAYMRACLDSMLDENVQLIEYRRGDFGQLYYFDETTGSQVQVSDTDELDSILQFRREYARANPAFIDFVYIVDSKKKLTRDKVNSSLARSIQLQAIYSDLIRGFDMVGEEDQGHTLLFHRDSLSAGFNASHDTLNAFSLMLHAGETSWPDDVEPAQVGDDVATLDNLFDAVLLKTKRIGHGLGLFKIPSLYKYLRDRDIAVEVCPTSNQILGNCFCCFLLSLQ
jgi:adenosine deaminase CECR1